MKTTHRSYVDESGDFTRLCRFVVQEHDHVRACSTWCLGRVVDWKYGLYDTKLAVAAFCDQNAHLWFDAFGDMVGVALSESGDASFAIITAPGYRFLFEPILDWVLDTWGNRGFARAVLLACMERLRDMGMRSAYITGYSHEAIALYGSLNHTDEKHCYVYEAVRV